MAKIHGILACAFSLALFPSLSPGADAGAEASPASRPNIVFILADDHGPQAVSAYDDRLIRTPNIDRLAKDGVRFTHAYANNSICSPSRAVLLTGKYNHLCGVEKLGGHFDGSQQTFPKLMRSAGYLTAIVGKWHLFTEPTGFDYYCVAPGNGGEYTDPKLKETGAPWGNGDSGGETHKGYMTDVITDISLNWLEHRDTTKPFCLMIHHKAAHAPHIPAPRHKDLFKDVVFPEPPTLLDDYKGRAPEAFADKLHWSRLIQASPFDIDLPGVKVRAGYTGDKDHDTRLAYQAYTLGYLRLVAALDENVGRVLDYLDRTGLSRNTIVVYTSDNGFFLGEHGFFNKMWMYEEGFHLPLLIRMPGSHGATVRDDCVGMIDMAPTLLDLAGVPVPPDIQGRSMKPLLSGEPVAWRDTFYYHYYGVAGMSPSAVENREIIGIRTSGSKLICYPRWKNGAFWELFDLKKDPLETHNLYGDPARRPEIESLKKRLREQALSYRDQKTVELLDSL